MGFFSKVWKGIKKGFKKIGKSIKRGFKKFGKFMGKIGILGQIAMTFILPGIGGLLMKGLGSMLGLGSNITSLSGLAGNLAGSSTKVLSALGKGLQTGLKVVNAVKAPFKTITDGIMTLGKTAVNKVGNVFGFDPIFKGPTTFSDAFTQIKEQTKATWDFKGYGEKLKNIQTNAEALNVLKEANPSIEGLQRASATAESVGQYVDPKLQGAMKPFEVQGPPQEFSGPPTQMREYSGTRLTTDPTGEMSFEYDTVVDPVTGKTQSIYGTQMYEKELTGSYSEAAPQSLLGKAWDKVTELPEKMVDATLQSVAALPGEMLTTKAYQVAGLTPTASDLTPDYKDPSSPFYIAGDNLSYQAYQQNLATQQDPNEFLSVAYQEENPQAINWYNNNVFGGANNIYTSMMKGFAPDPYAQITA